MKKLAIAGFVLCVALTQISCTKTLQRRYDQRHGTTGSTYDGTDYSTDRDTYRRDYDKIAETDVRRTDGNPDYNQRLVNQYQEMDKLGDLVLYELDIMERRWNVLINEYKTAKSSSKTVIANELDKIDADQKVLYKAYTNIYRNGKTNWPVVKSEVESSLRSVRRVVDR